MLLAAVLRLFSFSQEGFLDLKTTSKKLLKNTSTRFETLTLTPTAWDLSRDEKD